MISSLRLWLGVSCVSSVLILGFAAGKTGLFHSVANAQAEEAVVSPEELESTVEAIEDLTEAETSDEEVVVEKVIEESDGSGTLEVDIVEDGRVVDSESVSIKEQGDGSLLIGTDEGEIVIQEGATVLPDGQVIRVDLPDNIDFSQFEPTEQEVDQNTEEVPF